MKDHVTKLRRLVFFSQNFLPCLKFWVEWEFLSTCWVESFPLKHTHTNSIWKKHNGNNVRRNEVQQILWDILELTFESVRNLGWISLVSPGIRASVYPHRQGTTCTPATPATHQASDVRWMTPWRYYRERNYKRKHIGITEDILISQQKLWSNFLWDTSLKLRYHTYAIAWRDPFPTWSPFNQDRCKKTHAAFRAKDVKGLFLCAHTAGQGL